MLKEEYGLIGCVGIIDGTHIILQTRPGFQGELYWTRKQQYAINLQMVCDHRRRIIYYQTGYPGSVHDSTCYKETDLFRHPNRYLSGGQYIIGDSAYPLSRKLLTLYKAAAANIAENTAFNGQFSRARVIVEHTVGVLKARFGSLQGLRLRLRDDNDLPAVHKWIACAVQLHNFLIDQNNSWNEE